MTGSALRPGGSTRRWRRVRVAILVRDLYTCRYCGAYAATVDHVLRRRDGGTDDPANLVAACWDCQRARELTDAQVEAVLRRVSHERPGVLLAPGAPDTHGVRKISPRDDPEPAGVAGFRPIVGDYTRDPE